VAHGPASPTSRAPPSPPPRPPRSAADRCSSISGDDGLQTGLPSPAAHQGFTKGILRYDLDRDAWSTAGQLDLPPPVTLPTAPWKDGFVLFNGEVKPGVRTPQVFLFTPPAESP
jgi:N-acetylneuraminate epimerase